MSLIQDLAAACAGCYSGAAPTWENGEKTIHAYLSEVQGLPCIAFEGTTDLQEWLVDFFAVPIHFDPYIGPVHFGIFNGVWQIKALISNYLFGKGAYFVTGHSKGAGEAILFTALMKERLNPPLACYVFEPPQVGGPKLRDYLSDVDVKWTATTNKHGRDIVTQIPFGPEWSHINDPILLPVPDEYDIPQKHRIPAVIEALAAVSVS